MFVKIGAARINTDHLVFYMPKSVNKKDELGNIVTEPVLLVKTIDADTPLTLPFTSIEARQKTLDTLDKQLT